MSRFTYANPTDTAVVTIANGQSVSGTIDCGGLRLFGLLLPSAWTTANLTVQASLDGTNFSNVFDLIGNEYLISAAASRMVMVPVADFAAFQLLRLRSGTSASPVNQAADRNITALLRSV